MACVAARQPPGILFVPEVLLTAKAMKGGMEILRPLLADTGAEPIGKMVIGTVKGGIHGIGKNLVSMMMEGAGFEVIDIGINNPVLIAPGKDVVWLEVPYSSQPGTNAGKSTKLPNGKDYGFEVNSQHIVASKTGG